MADGSSYFFSNKWHHHDITSIVKAGRIFNVLVNFLIISDT